MIHRLTSALTLTIYFCLVATPGPLCSSLTCPLSIICLFRIFTFGEMALLSFLPFSSFQFFFSSLFLWVFLRPPPSHIKTIFWLCSYPLSLLPLPLLLSAPRPSPSFIYIFCLPPSYHTSLSPHLSTTSPSFPPNAYLPFAVLYLYLPFPSPFPYPHLLLPSSLAHLPRPLSLSHTFPLSWPRCPWELHTCPQDWGRRKVHIWLASWPRYPVSSASPFLVGIAVGANPARHHR